MGTGLLRGGTLETRFLKVVFVILAALCPLAISAAPGGLTFSQSAEQVDRYDYVEITAAVSAPDVRNPFEDASLSGTMESADGHHWTVDGFADSVDGSVYSIRFMPPAAGEYKYSVTYKQGEFTEDVERQRFAPWKRTGADCCASIRSIPGTLCGKAPGSISSSMAPPRTGWWAGATTT